MKLKTSFSNTEIVGLIREYVRRELSLDEHLGMVYIKLKAVPWKSGDGVDVSAEVEVVK